MRRLLLATAVVTSLIGIGAWESVAHAGPAAAAGAMPSFQHGQPVSISVPVTNTSTTPCAVSAVADGALAFTHVDRNGTEVLPQVGSAFYDDGPPSGADASQTVAAGATLQVSATSRAGSGKDSGAGAQVLRTVSWSSDTRSMVAEWPVDAAGTYTVTAVVQVLPAATDASVPNCAGSTAPVTLRFVVAGTSRSGVATWQTAAAAGAVLVLVVLALWLWRRHRRGHTAVAMAIVLLGGTLAPQIAPTRASAIINFPVNGPDSKAAFDTCVANFNTMGGDLKDVMSTLTGLDYTVTITPTLRGSTPVINRVDITPGTHSANIVWSWWSTSPLRGGGVPRDPCAQLWHELVHAYDDATGNLGNSWCDDTGITTADVRAVMAENKYRAKFGLPQRKDYDGRPLPASMTDCKNPPKQNWGPPPNSLNDDCVQDCATTNGDPHLGPFDGKLFDFQAAGEFDALVSRDDSMRVQVRQQPVPGSDSVSVNTAIALRVGTDRVEVAQTGGSTDSFSVSVNGTSATGDGPPEGTTLPGGGRLTRWSDLDIPYVLVQWPDGSRVRVRSVGTWGLAFDVVLNPARRGHVAGLLGTDSGTPGSSVTTRDGKPFTDMSSPALYQVFGESWRITQADSLFSYASGQSTATFTDRAFPRHPVTAATLPNRAALEKLCRAMGLTRDDIVDACVLDLGLTGQAAFADSAVTTQNVIARAAQGGSTTGDSGTSSSPPPIVIQPGGTLHDGDRVQASITAAGQRDTYKLDLGDATVFRLADVTGEPGALNNSSLTFTLDGPDGSDSPGFTVTSNYQYRVKKGGAYTLTVYREDSDTGKYSFRLVTAKEQRIPMTIGQKITGSLDAPGRINLYTFDATTAAQLLLTSDSTGCDLSVAVVEDSPAPRVYSPAPLCYDLPLATLEPGKRYVLIVWSADSKTGAYSFTTTTTGAPASRQRRRPFAVCRPHTARLQLIELQNLPVHRVPGVGEPGSDRGFRGGRERSRCWLDVAEQLAEEVLPDIANDFATMDWGSMVDKFVNLVELSALTAGKGLADSVFDIVIQTVDSVRDLATAH